MAVRTADGEGMEPHRPIREGAARSCPCAGVILRSRVVQVGAAMLILGTGPLVAFVIFAPRSNPIGPGLLAFFTFWPSVVMIVIGAILAVARAGRKPAGSRSDSDRPKIAA